MKPVYFRGRAEFEAAMAKPPYRGALLHVQVLHDDWCAMATGGSCCCSPEFEVEPLTVESFEHGQSRQDAWLGRGGGKAS